MKIYSAKVVCMKTGNTKITLGFYKTKELLRKELNIFLERVGETPESVRVNTVTDSLFG